MVNFLNRFVRAGNLASDPMVEKLSYTELEQVVSALLETKRLQQEIQDHYNIKIPVQSLLNKVGQSYFKLVPSLKRDFSETPD